MRYLVAWNPEDHRYTPLHKLFHQQLGGRCSRFRRCVPGRRARLGRILIFDGANLTCEDRRRSNQCPASDRPAEKFATAAPALALSALNFRGTFASIHVSFFLHLLVIIQSQRRIGVSYGYATEAASAARDHGFAHLGFNQNVSFTVRTNQRSRNVMERIGMTHSAEDDFEHPLLPPGHPLRHHVLYRLARSGGGRGAKPEGHGEQEDSPRRRRDTEVKRKI